MRWGLPPSLLCATLFALALMSCEGDQGPTGPQGAQTFYATGARQSPFDAQIGRVEILRLTGSYFPNRI
jgi:hypothetical protein